MFSPGWWRPALPALWICRVIFRFHDHDVFDVGYLDYH
jgi:hypothetical protein